MSVEPEPTLRIATRRSPLALAQTGWIVRQWEAQGVRCELVELHTEGDRVLDRALDLVGGKGLFTTELEEAILAGTAEVAVHSLKDLPTRLPEGLVLGAVSRREDPRDVLVNDDGRTLGELSAGSRLGTSSLRRAALLHAHWPHLTVVPVRGNLGTRLRKMREEGLDGLVLAAAGVIRLGLTDKIAEYLDPRWMVPAPGQGALAVEIAQAKPGLKTLLDVVHDAETYQATMAERRVLDLLGGNCQTPIGAYAVREGSDWTFQAWVGLRDGGAAISRNWKGPQLEVGVSWVLEEMRAAGVDRMVGSQ